ncbi:MAG TPA: M23 family metallopeptidase [Thermoleophilaceae bacterium]|nr:M23 family metallopeptidase [Thermoleophilaceae bacterium]
MRQPRALLICLVTLAAFGPAAAAHASHDGGVAAPGQPFLGPVRDAGAGGSAPSGGESGGASVGDLPERRARARRLRTCRRFLSRRRAARCRAARRERASRPPQLLGLSGGSSPVAPLPAPEPAPGATPESGHRFPVAGPFDLGGAGSRFGAPRRGHIHQGQDISASEGTPVIAPWAGTVEWVRYQRRGAGWYLVLDGDGEDRDYVFMHLRRGSILVTAGQHVDAGDQLAQVGNTGASSGAHLHFEVWVGGWYVRGGAPVDPLPLLEAWLGL